MFGYLIQSSQGRLNYWIIEHFQISYFYPKRFFTCTTFLDTTEKQVISHNVSKCQKYWHLKIWIVITIQWEIKFSCIGLVYAGPNKTVIHRIYDDRNSKLDFFVWFMAYVLATFVVLRSQRDSEYLHFSTNGEIVATRLKSCVWNVKSDLTPFSKWYIENAPW